MSSALDIEQIQKLRECLKGHHLESLITLALTTGLRRDELLSLTWQEVNLQRQELRFQNAKTWAWETVSITDEVVELLKQHKASQQQIQYAAGLTWANLGLVFPDQKGSPLHPHQLMKEWREVRDLAGLPRMSFHALRMTAKQKELAKLKEDPHHI